MRKTAWLLIIALTAGLFYGSVPVHAEMLKKTTTDAPAAISEWSEETGLTTTEIPADAVEIPSDATESFSGDEQPVKNAGRMVLFGLYSNSDGDAPTSAYYGGFSKDSEYIAATIYGLNLSEDIYPVFYNSSMKPVTTLYRAEPAAWTRNREVEAIQHWSYLLKKTDDPVWKTDADEEVLKLGLSSDDYDLQWNDKQGSCPEPASIPFDTKVAFTPVIAYYNVPQRTGNYRKERYLLTGSWLADAAEVGYETYENKKNYDERRPTLSGTITPIIINEAGDGYLEFARWGKRCNCQRFSTMLYRITKSGIREEVNVSDYSQLSTNVTGFKKKTYVPGIGMTQYTKQYFSDCTDDSEEPQGSLSFYDIHSQEKVLEVSGLQNEITPLEAVPQESRSIFKDYGVLRMVAAYNGVFDHQSLIRYSEEDEESAGTKDWYLSLEGRFADEDPDFWHLGYQTPVVGRKVQLMPRSLEKPDIQAADLEWKSSDPAIASVDQNGLVTPLSPGDVLITATAADGVYGYFEMSVELPIESMTLKSSETLTLRVGETICWHDLLNITPQNTSDRYRIGLRIESSHELAGDVSSDEVDYGIAAVNLYTEELRAKAEGEGKVIFTVTPYGKNYSEQIRLERPIRVSSGGGKDPDKPDQPDEPVVEDEDTKNAQMICLSRRNAVLLPGETMALTAVVKPAGAEDKRVLWKSDTDAVSVEEDTGLIKAKHPGQAVVTAVSKADPSLSASCLVAVRESDIVPGDLPEGEAAPENGTIWIGGLEKQQVYTGTAIKPVVRIYSGTRLLCENRDYKLSYLNNTKVSAAGKPAKIKIRWMGNYTGTSTEEFTIVKAPLSAEDGVLHADPVYASAGGRKNNRILPALYLSDDTPVKYTAGNVTVSYLDEQGNPSTCRDAGTYIIRLSAKEGTGACFTGSLDVPLIVTADQTPMSSVKIVAEKKGSVACTGEPVFPKLTLRNGQTILKEQNGYESQGDYRIEYASGDDYTDPGSHTIYLAGTGGNYVGRVSFTYKITGKKELSNRAAAVVTFPEQFASSISSSDASSNPSYYEAPFTKGGAKPRVEVRYRGKLLAEGVDYTLSYSGNRTVSVGGAAVTVKGKGSYRGTLTEHFSVSKRDLSDLFLFVSDRIASQKADDYKKTSILFTDHDYKVQKLINGSDYEVLWTDLSTKKPAAGSVIGITIRAVEGSCYTGEIYDSFRIIENSQDLSKAKVQVHGGKAYSYTGMPILPGKDDLTVTLRGKALDRDSYEILGVFNNTGKGTGTMILRGANGSSFGGVKKAT
nr:Ig-like domain-containing protein [Lachnospiraceae bacterium]